jgi:hypothetical protein
LISTLCNWKCFLSFVLQDNVSIHIVPCTQRKKVIETLDKFPIVLCLLLVWFWRSSNLWLWRCVTVIRYGSVLKSFRKRHTERLHVVYCLCCKIKTGWSVSGLCYCLAIIILADRNGRCCWTRNNHWPNIPFTCHSYS